MHVDDLERVLEINAANVPAVGDIDIERLQHLHEQSAIALVCEIGQAIGHEIEIAGFCLLLAADADYDSINYRWFAEHHPGSLYLDRVAFDERFCGRGLGTTMYADIERRIRAEHPDASSFTLEVNIDPPNEPSLAFHHKLGFTEVGRQMSKGIEVAMMRRAL